MAAFVSALVMRFAGWFVVGTLLRGFRGVVVCGLRGVWVCRSCGWRAIPVGCVGWNVVGPIGIGAGGVEIVGGAGGAGVGRAIVLHARMRGGGCVHRVVGIWVDGVSGDYTLTAEDAGSGSGGDAGLAVILRGEKGAIGAGSVEMLLLHRSWVEVMLAFGSAFRSGWLRDSATSAAVEADAIDGRVVVDHRGVVSVVDDGGVHVGDRGVVVIDAATPFATNEANTAVAEAVVNPAIKADVRSPVAGIAIGPVARRPDIADSGANRLGVDRKNGRAVADGDANSDLRRGR